MRIFGFLFASGLLLTGAAHAATTGTEAKSDVSAARVVTPSAPLDEYFGRYGQSVLEIRNRISALLLRRDEELKGDLSPIEYVDDGIVGWREKYPHDPWLAEAIAHTFECYVRAGAGTSRHAVTLLGVLLSAFPDSPASQEALAAMAPRAAVLASPVQPTYLTIRGKVLDAASGQPVPNATVAITADEGAVDLSIVPFTITRADGSFSFDNVISTQAKFLFVSPPRGANYTYSRTPLPSGPGEAVVKLHPPTVAAVGEHQ